MMASVFLAICVLAAQPAATDDGELKSQVRELVKQLDGGLANRERAEKKLIELGPAVLDLLPDLPDEPRYADARHRIARIRHALQEAAVERAAAASLITLKAKKMPLSKILAAMEQQTGNRIVDGRREAGGPVADPELAVNFDKTPFWQALDTVLDQAGLTVYPYGQDAVQVVPRPEQQLSRVGRAAYSGPFRIEPVRILARRELRTAASPSMQLSVEASWEPRLRPIGLKQRMGDVQATDDAGKPLVVDDPQAVSEALLRRGAIAVDMILPFGFPSREVKQIASLKGSVQAIVPGKVEEFRFTDLLKAKNARKRIAGATVTLEQVRKSEENLWEVFVRVQFDDAGKALESHRTWITLNEAYLEGPDGKPIRFDSTETTHRSDNEFGMGYVFQLDKPPENLAFIYKTPGAIFTRSFPYELKNIPLP